MPFKLASVSKNSESLSGRLPRTGIWRIKNTNKVFICGKFKHWIFLLFLKRQEISLSLIFPPLEKSTLVLKEITINWHLKNSFWKINFYRPLAFGNTNCRQLKISLALPKNVTDSLSLSYQKAFWNSKSIRNHKSLLRTLLFFWRMIWLRRIGLYFSCLWPVVYH